jgi:hypothetical protein
VVVVVDVDVDDGGPAAGLEVAELSGETWWKLVNRKTELLDPGKKYEN